MSFGNWHAVFITDINTATLGKLSSSPPPRRHLQVSRKQRPLSKTSQARPFAFSTSDTCLSFMFRCNILTDSSLVISLITKTFLGEMSSLTAIWWFLVVNIIEPFRLKGRYLVNDAALAFPKRSSGSSALSMIRIQLQARSLKATFTNDLTSASSSSMPFILSCRPIPR